MSTRKILGFKIGLLAKRGNGMDVLTSGLMSILRLVEIESAISGFGMEGK